MPEMPSGDPYIENILEQVPPKVARTLTRDQWEGFRAALKAAHLTGRHFVDIRFILPLYLTRIYCILIFGKDTRERVEHVLIERRKRMGMLIGAAVLATGFLFLLTVILLVLYILRIAAEMDLVPGFGPGQWPGQ